ncbi:hypothetical protein [Cognatazoarcus halotolerans]|uniref:hypothetical protein n=1 Tax=Cognatazoarcus halotolerans TaxID=2686016 RepID=UPI001357C4F5|nr:hypothetical protein [Cognatazoarcus halotolerans]MCB1901766.1 hypothetical protein [Rhodocyclaceae bacterium]MCP5308233.1 hypothetical protein [Zoogloeaceae bacterium]MCP5360915.1 hypothetical protein [Nevskiaceae bacterium]
MKTISEHDATIVAGGLSALGAIGAVGGFVLAGALTMHPVAAIAGGAAGYVGGELLDEAVDDALANIGNNPDENPGK